LEQAYFQPIDNSAAKAKDELLSDSGGEWSPELVSAWTRFLLALVHRDPHSLSLYRERLKRNLKIFCRDTQKYLETIREADDPQNYLDMLAEDPTYYDSTALRLLPSVIDNGNVGQSINGMNWTVLRLYDPCRSLLISDYPLVMSNGIRRDDGHLALALGPTRLFIACHRKKWLDQLIRDHTPAEIIANYNKCVVERANHFVGSQPRTSLFQKRSTR
jgi:hypothetical protein